MDFPDFGRGVGTRMPAPAHGIMAAHRPRGWLGREWLDLLSKLGRSHASRVARGRSLARGRVSELWFSPGLANAMVCDKEECKSTLRTRTYNDTEWRKVTDVLVADLGNVAALLEGRLPETLVQQLQAKRIELLPSNDELDGDCTCGDYILPCAHLCAVHTVLADALDGEPFLLFTLRGRTREQLLGALRRRWGDRTPVAGVRVVTEEAPPSGGQAWTESPTPLPPLTFHFHPAEVAAAGLRALGPPPGEDDIVAALEPLYEAGAQASFEIAMQDSDETHNTDGSRRRRRRRLAVVPPPRPVTKMAQSAAEDGSAEDLTEQLVNLLAEITSAKSSALAERLGVDKLLVRNELIALEQLGIVYRTGATRGTRWHLG